MRIAGAATGTAPGAPDQIRTGDLRLERTKGVGLRGVGSQRRCDRDETRIYRLLPTRQSAASKSEPQAPASDLRSIQAPGAVSRSSRSIIPRTSQGTARTESAAAKKAISSSESPPGPGATSGQAAIQATSERGEASAPGPARTTLTIARSPRCFVVLLGPVLERLAKLGSSRTDSTRATADAICRLSSSLRACNRP